MLMLKKKTALFVRSLYVNRKARPLSIIRMMYGFLIFFETLRYYPQIRNLYNPDHFHFTYPLTPFIHPWSGFGMEIHFFIMALAALCVCLGLMYRFSIIVLTLTFSFIFLIDVANYLNHFYLICIMNLILCFLNAHYDLSFDRFLFKKINKAPKEIPQWNYTILQAQLFIVLFYAGVAKLNWDWLHGQPMLIWFEQWAQKRKFGHQYIFSSHTWAFIFSYVGLLYDLIIPFLFLYRKTILGAYIATVVFSLMNSFLFSIGIFPYLMLILCLSFFVPFKWIKDENLNSVRQKQNKWIYVITGYILVQILIPLRPIIYGNSSWDKKHQRFSWRMKLNHKYASSHILLIEDNKGQKLVTSVGEKFIKLNKKQDQKLLFDPYLIYIYIQELKKRLREAGHIPKKIHLTYTISLNGHRPKFLISPKTNLANVEYNHILNNDWVTPQD